MTVVRFLQPVPNLEDFVMEKYTPITKRCKLCGDTHTFTEYGEFWMCKCDSVGFDAGDGFIARFLGKPENMETIETPDYFKTTYTAKVIK